MRRLNRWGFLVLGIAIGLTVSTVLTAQVEDRRQKMMDEFFRPMAWLVNKLDAAYVEEVDFPDLLEGATQGMLSRLDRYSTYLPPEMHKEFKEGNQGQFGGLGIQIQFLPIEKVVRVDNPIPGTPAFRQGVLSGDLIVQVREESTGKVTRSDEFKNVHDAVKILRGEAGTDVTITVVHGQGGKMEDITVRRAIIKIPGVRGAAIINEEHEIGYVYIPHFHERMVRDLKETLAQLREQGMKGLVIDMRFDPGGLLLAAQEMADLFLQEGKVIVSTKGRTSPERVLKAEHDEMYPGLPVVVLVNRASASAAEIVTAALKDHGRAVVIGEPTFGKASVQNLFDNIDGESGIKLTVARYYTPDGTLIEGKGVQPDVLMKLSDEDYRKLAAHISKVADFTRPNNGEGPKEEEPAASDDGEKPTENDGEKAEDDKPFVDVQLDRAVAELVGELTGHPVPREAPAEAETAEHAVNDAEPAPAPAD